jgi:secreted trypsin-like serine protease
MNPKTNNKGVEMNHFTKLSLVAAMALAGCGGAVTAENPVETAQDQSEIIGGTVNTGDPAIVALYAIKDGATSGALCTATVISPTVVLTAAHCVHPDTVGTGNKFYVMTAPDITDKTHPSPKLNVKEVHYDPKFDAKLIFNGHDIAVAILETPTTITPIPWNKDPLTAAMKGQAARIVGYGLNDSFGQKGAGIKRQATVKLNNYDELFVKTGSLLPWKVICSGDSGGPVLMKLGGVEKVVGVNSFGIVFCLTEASSSRTDIYKDFVAKYLP